MRQASWNEVFAPRARPAVTEPEVPEQPTGWRRLLWWEDILTFALLGVAFLAVVGDINRVGWVDDMPSLYPIAFVGLLMGFLLARLRWPEGFVHLVALPIGAAAVLGQILLTVPGDNPVDRFQALTTRMGHWFDAAFTGGISNDSLPFIVAVVALSWLGAYLSSWAVFRWQNAWLGLIPGGTALLMNISYLPGQFSFAFLIFLFAGVLLVTRLHVMQHAESWREDDTPYPALLSLSVLHAAFWLAILLIAAAWLMPQANQLGPAEALWQKATGPVTERAAGFGRLFVSVGDKQSVLLHDFEGTLPFYGKIELSDAQVLEIITERLDQPQYLRADVYEIYTSAGWKQESRGTLLLEADRITDVDVDVRLRRPMTIDGESAGLLGDVIPSIGPLRRPDRDATARVGGDPSDIAGVEAERGLNAGIRFQSVGSVSVASEEELHAAGTDYPPWVRDGYLQLPNDLPNRVRGEARSITSQAMNPYDKALAVQDYLRAIPYDLDVPDVPGGRDAIDYFLFDAKRGYFDYHASAMVVLLRSEGVPSRLVVGYALDNPQRIGDKDRYAVTEQDAYAWPEVYFPGLGWVEFNPTPNLPPIERSGAVEPGTEPEPRDPPPAGSLNFEELFPDVEGGGDATDDVLTTGSSDTNLWLPAGIALGLGLVLATAAGGLRLAWVRGIGGLEPPARLWGQTVRLASWAGLPPKRTQTPKEYAGTLRKRVAGLDDVDALADAYERHEYGRKQTATEESEAVESAWRVVRGRLLRKLLRLK